jgi:hypothetical protein
MLFTVDELVPATESKQHPVGKVGAARVSSPKVSMLGYRIINRIAFFGSTFTAIARVNA